MNITKVIIPAAGKGTRFLPYTHAVPKELVTLLNKPAIAWVVEEGIMAHLEQFYIITSHGKESIATYLDTYKKSTFTYIRQTEQLGLGHAVLQAQHVIGKEHVAILLPDDIMAPTAEHHSCIGQLMRIALQEKASVIAVQEVDPSMTSAYGIIKVRKQLTPSLYHVADLVEKPRPQDAPSSLAIVGRYILSSKIFQSLTEIAPDATGELQLTDAISHMIHNNEKVYAFKIPHVRYDVGTPLGLAKAVLGLGLQDKQIGPALKQYTQELISPSLVHANSKLPPFISQ